MDDRFWPLWWVYHDEYTSVYKIRATVCHNVKLLGNPDFTKLLYYIISQPWKNIEFVSKSIVALIC